jgi:hypothetical protein
MSVVQAPIALALTALAALSPTPPAWDDPPASAAADIVVAHGAPSRLGQSSGDLYWTFNRIAANGRSHSVVYRTAKSARPGQERALFTLNAVAREFGAVTHTRVGGVGRYYVVVNDLRNKRSSIRPLPGSGRFVINSPRPIGSRDLVANGRHLFWADSGGVRRASVDGRGLRTLYPGTNVSRVAVSGEFLYFARDTQIIRTDLNGGHRTRLITMPTAPVTAMHVHGSTVYYGLRNGTVRARTGLAQPVTYQSQQRGRRVTSIFFDGRNALWSDCSRSTGNACWIRYRGRPTVFFGGNQVHDLRGDQRSAYYADTVGVQRHAR